MGLRFAHTFVVAAAILAFAAPAALLDAQTNPDTGSIAGRVLDPLGDGVPNLTLEVSEITENSQPARPNNRHTTQSDSSGYFELNDLPTGTYIVGGSPGSLRPVEVTLKPGERVERNLQVTMVSVTITATVCAECAEPMIGLEWLRRAMDPDEFHDQQVVPALLLRPEQLAITYPEALRAAAVEGTVVIEGSVGTNGVSTRFEVQSETHPDLNDAVTTALKDASWSPARVRGVAVEGPIGAQIDFVLRPQATNP